MVYYDRLFAEAQRKARARALKLQSSVCVVISKTYRRNARMCVTIETASALGGIGEIVVVLKRAIYHVDARGFVRREECAKVVVYTALDCNKFKKVHSRQLCFLYCVTLCHQTRQIIIRQDRFGGGFWSGCRCFFLKVIRCKCESGVCVCVLQIKYKLSNRVV